MTIELAHDDRRIDIPDHRRCPRGHTWVTSVRDKFGCPWCSKRKPKPGGGIDATHPAIAQRWSPTNGYPASLVTAQANRYGWFTCAEHDHEFVGIVSSIVSRGASCAVCAGRQIRAGFNDLATLHPDVAAFWHPDNPLRADEVAPFSHDVYRWLCSGCGFTWSQSVAKRVRAGGNCAGCAGRTLAPGVNDFASRHPVEAAEWDSSNDRRPDEVLEHSGYRATWRCRVHTNFTWKASVANRADGTGCPVCGGQLVVVGLNDLPTTHPRVHAKWSLARNDIDPFAVSANSGVIAWWDCDVHGPYQRRIETRARGHGCAECSTAGTSHGERELQAFVAEITGDGGSISRYRGIPGVREVDVFVPARSIAIEYNGVYWHSDRGGNGRDRNYHRDKYRRCKEAGVQLIQVWEDDWRTRRDAVESTLRAKLGVATRDGRIAARACEVVRPPRLEVQDLLERHHIQGRRDGTLYLGLRRPRGDLVAAMVVTRTKLTWTIDRYATAALVPGGFGKLLAELRRHVAASGGGKLVTFSDNEISDGALYAATGFTAGREIPPDYAYVAGIERVHKFNYRRARFRSDPALEYREELSESELARLNKLHRVWDSGKVRWGMEIPARGA
ncbi:Uncharacterised protein (plasmid) [Tsukamurella tyrosinosolvens]|uniref:Probable Zinc-ribbon domain-containing protein n=1 Tax=Tsukamurella tyrosinosolvens TaxID=57704 RepID=A0A1H4VHJ9_TSUTY|nr:zinc-ribbon domain-containing protein [Tsukamurella tyrosinosolvens]KXO90990.1 hypothetical protein AXK58_21400 [Tsukamurella tyrosinosolvens]SEC79844.1 Probable Zinc-ribbon domain-containing protein [Tsukamurella tyrosinosolvens]VEH90546.1 Uncharacterised protein [Tsukamurella tyrosinosolvens]